MGASTAYAPGATISLTEYAVEIATHLSESGDTSSSGGISSPLDALSIAFRSPGISLNCLRTSSIISAAALPTEIIVRAPNRYGNIAPIKQPAITGALDTLNGIELSRSTFSLNAARRERAVNTAE